MTKSFSPTELGNVYTDGPAFCWVGLDNATGIIIGDSEAQSGEFRGIFTLSEFIRQIGNGML